MPTNYKEFKQQQGRYSKIKQREHKIAALAAENTPEARKARRKMNDSRTFGRVSLGNAWIPNGKAVTTAKCSADRINKNFNSQK